jgi:hypothetical protein
MRDIPLSVYREWPSPNYKDPSTRGNALLVINIIFLTLVTLSIAIRLWSRFKVKYQSGMDDVMIVLAYVFTIGMTAVVLLANRNYGWNRHLWDVPVHMIEEANRIAFVAKIMFTLASSFTRLSLIFLYYRLIRDTNLRWYSWALHSSLAFNVMIIISFVLLVVFTCMYVSTRSSSFPKGFSLTILTDPSKPTGSFPMSSRDNVWTRAYQHLHAASSAALQTCNVPSYPFPRSCA